MQYTIQGLSAFLKEAASAFHAVRAICNELKAAGYEELKECARWSVQPGGKYYTVRNQSSVIAFAIPEKGFAPIQAVASHSDSPVFRIKQHAELEAAGKYVLLNTERYGGMIMSTWLDRPLSIAGRVLVRTQKGIEARLVNIDKDSLIIPNLAIHMNREVNDKCSFNAQKDMLPIYGDSSMKGSFDGMIAEAAGVNPEQVAGSDLYLYNRMAPSIWGKEDCYISAPRLDDLECAYTSLCAFLSAGAGEHINMYCVFDNEEVGSGTRQGADSTLLEDVIQRIANSLKADADDVRAALASSFLVSADNAHACHPNHPEKADATNRPFMNEGIVVKFSANQKYTTDGISNAIFADIMKRVGVPVQYFANRSDMIGGSTLGNISGAHVSIPAVDIGLAQLAMHSSYETAGTKDAEYMVRGLKAFYEAEIQATGDGVYEIG
ncbi:MAG: M18 family aminopeptidase [Clostridia bacterium]|nr:M18 family aminopeptidase [Clostridia bacterium]